MELTTIDVRVRVCIETSAGSYLFRCPTCQMSVVKSAEPRIVDLLVASGVELTTWSLPAELREPRFGPAIDHDDLLDFHTLLGGDEDAWFDDLVTLVEASETIEIADVLDELDDLTR